MMPLVHSVSELNKLKVRLFIETVWNEGQLQLIDELVAADYVGHLPCPGSRVLGPEGMRRLVSSRRLRFPDLYIKVEDQVAEDDRVVTRWFAAAAPGDGPVSSAPTDRPRRWAGISIIRLLAGKQVDSHTEYSHLAPDATR